MDLLVEAGPAHHSFGFTVESLASIAGVSRSTVYGHWETIAAANDDLGTAAATSVEGWRHRLIEQPPTLALADAVATATSAPADDLGLLARPVVAAWAPGSPARCKLAEWERAWLQAVGSWLEAHAAAHHRRFAGSSEVRWASIGLTAYLEGCQFVYGCHTAGTFEGWPAVARGPVAAGADRLVRQLTSPADTVADTAPHRILAPPLPAPLEAASPTAAQIVAKAWAAVRASTTPGGDLVAPDRLVSMDRLSRRLDVSERRLYGVWPTAAAMNGALVQHLADLDKDRIRTVMVDVLEEADRPEGAARTFVDAMQRLVIVQDNEPHRLLAFALAWLDPTTACALTEAVASTWWDGAVVRAIFAVLGRQPLLEDGFQIDGAYQLLVGLGLGLQQTAQLLPEVCGELVDEQAPLLGSLVHQLLLALTEPIAAPRG